jgi:hypothetical protein
MRRLTYVLLLALALPLMAAAADNNLPQLEPLPEPPPPPPGLDADPGAEPEVTITKKGEDTIEEYRMNGELYMMKVTPPHGVSYYLLKEDKEGPWERMDSGPGDPMAIPKWVLFTF